MNSTNLIPHILVVDDELAMRETLQEILELEGFRVSQADGGEAALKILAPDQDRSDAARSEDEGHGWPAND